MTYIVLIAVPTFFYILDAVFKTKKHIFEKAGLLVLIVLSTFRENSGVDFYTYKAEYVRLLHGAEWNDINFDIAYKVLTYVCSRIGAPFELVLFVLATIIAVCLYHVLAYYLSSQYRWLGLLIFLLYFDLYVYMLSAIRQSVAVMLVMVATICIEKNDIKRYMFFAAFSYMFHWSAIIMIPSYWLFRFLKQSQKHKVLIYLFAIIIFFYGGTLFLARYGRIINERVGYYFSINMTQEYNSTIAACVYLLVGIIIILISYSGIKLEKTKIVLALNQKRFALTSAETAMIIFCALKVLQNIAYNLVIPRFQMYFYCFVPIYIANSVGRFKGPIRVIIVAFVIVIFVIFFYTNLHEQYVFYGNFTYAFF